MILHQDVTGYQVGKEIFKRDGLGQAYNKAFKEHLATGRPIVTLGPNSTFDKELRRYVLDEAAA